MFNIVIKSLTHSVDSDGGDHNMASHLELIWYINLNTYFQFLNNIIYISTHFFHLHVFLKKLITII